MPDQDNGLVVATPQDVEVRRVDSDEFISVRDVMDNKDAVWSLAKALATGYGKDSPEKIVTKMMIGRTMGIPAVAAAGNIHIVSGSVQIGVHMIAACVKAAGWSVQIEDSDPPGTECAIRLTHPTQPEVAVKYTMEMAERQGLTKNHNWKTQPWNMLYARAMAMAGKRACPDRLMGIDEYSDVVASTVTVGADESRGARERLRAAREHAAETRDMAEEIMGCEASPQTEQDIAEPPDGLRNSPQEAGMFEMNTEETT